MKPRHPRTQGRASTASTATAGDLDISPREALQEQQRADLRCFQRRKASRRNFKVNMYGSIETNAEV